MLFFVILFVLALGLDDNPEIFQGPKTKNDTSQWWKEKQEWVAETKIKIKYSSEIFDKYSLWTENDYVQPQVMIMDRELFREGKFYVEEFLQNLKNRYGGVSSVLLWFGYPNIGIDGRNQIEMILSLPNGEKGLKDLVREFHRFSVKVAIPIYPWDIGTHKIDDLAKEFGKLVAENEIDIINGDTMDAMYKDLFFATLKSYNYSVVLEPELYGTLDSLYYTKSGWGYWDWPLWSGIFTDNPPADKYKMIESRRQTHVCQRWAQEDRYHQIQYAFFNGVGYNSWENVWSIFNSFTDRNGQLLKIFSKILNFFKSEFFSSREWQPHVLTIQNNVYASYFPHKSKNGQAIWNFINRNNYDLPSTSPQITLELQNPCSYYSFYDIYHGIELKPIDLKKGEGKFSEKCSLKFAMEKLSITSLFMIPKKDVSKTLTDFLIEMKDLTKKPLSSFNNDFKFLQQEMQEFKRTKRNQSVSFEDMKKVSFENNSFDFLAQGVEIEPFSDELDGVDVQYPWEAIANKIHKKKTLELFPFMMDTFPVTNKKFKKFLEESSYIPKSKENFLKDWISDKEYPKGYDKKPVTYVSQNDAIEYCKFYGKRLPNEWEWQAAGQGPKLFTYPWGNDFDEKKIPKKDTSRQPEVPDDVDAHPEGASSFGIQDLVGNVWQMSNIFSDDHSLGLILKGGSKYTPQGSMWYFPQITELQKHGKWLSFSDSYDRSKFTSFRCVADL